MSEISRLSASYEIKKKIEKGFTDNGILLLLSHSCQVLVLFDPDLIQDVVDILLLILLDCENSLVFQSALIGLINLGHVDLKNVSCDRLARLISECPSPDQISMIFRYFQEEDLNIVVSLLKNRISACDSFLSLETYHVHFLNSFVRKFLFLQTDDLKSLLLVEFIHLDLVDSIFSHFSRNLLFQFIVQTLDSKCLFNAKCKFFSYVLKRCPSHPFFSILLDHIYSIFPLCWKFVGEKDVALYELIIGVLKAQKDRACIRKFLESFSVKLDFHGIFCFFENGFLEDLNFRSDFLENIRLHAHKFPCCWFGLAKFHFRNVSNGNFLHRIMSNFDLEVCNSCMEFVSSSLVFDKFYNEDMFLPWFGYTKKSSIIVIGPGRKPEISRFIQEDDKVNDILNNFFDEKPTMEKENPKGNTGNFFSSELAPHKKTFRYFPILSEPGNLFVLKFPSSRKMNFMVKREEISMSDTHVFIPSENSSVSVACELQAIISNSPNKD